jgi:hypothetical protein
MSSQYTIQQGDAEAPVTSSGILTFPEIMQWPEEVDASLLPTTDPAVAGRVYSDSGTLKVSAG